MICDAGITLLWGLSLSHWALLSLRSGFLGRSGGTFGTESIGGHVICHVVTGWQGGSDAVGIVVGCLRCGTWLFSITMIWMRTMQLL